MTIVYCIPATYNSGGMERVLALKANALVALGYTVHIITTDQCSRPSFFEMDGRIRHHDLDINYEGNNGGSVWRKLLDYPLKQRRHRRALRDKLREIDPDIVISMFGHEMPFLCQLGGRSKKILEYHFSKLRRLQYGRTGIWRLTDIWRTRMDARRVRAFDRFVVLTEEDKALWGNLPNITVIPNPLSFEVDTPSPLTEERVIAVGRYSSQKNFEELLYIWSEVQKLFPSWQLEIWGDGEDREALEALKTKLSLSQVHLQHPSHDMPQQYRRSSIYAMTSRYEGLPMVLIEAQTMGLPIVSYTCPCGPRDVVKDGVTGYLLSEGDRQGFARSLQALMQDTQLRAQMGAQARKASFRYAPQTIIPQWTQLFDQLLEPR